MNQNNLNQNKIDTLDNIFGIVTKKHTNDCNVTDVLSKMNGKMNNLEKVDNNLLQNINNEILTDNVNDKSFLQNKINVKNEVNIVTDANNIKEILSNTNKKLLIQKIKLFHKEEHLEILKIVKINKLINFDECIWT